MAVISLLIGLLGALPLVLLTPPLQVPDEFQHFARAYQLSELRIWSRVRGDEVGDELPTSLSDFAMRFLGSNREHAKRMVTRQPLRETLADRDRRLQPDETSFLGFKGAAFYSPLPYVPQATAIRIGRTFDASPLMLLYAGRLANALAAIALLAAAVLITPFGRGILMVCGLLPMTLYQDASLSPDAMVIACASLYTAIALRAQSRNRWTAVDIVAAIAAALVFISLKPVYAPLLLVGLVPNIFSKDRAAGWLAVYALVVSCVLAATWLWLHSTTAAMQLARSGTSIRDQMSFIVTHPAAYARVMISTLSANAFFYYRSMIGTFGWLNVAPPDLLLMLPVASALFAMAAWGDDDSGRPTTSRAAAIFQLALALACIPLVMTSLYLVWTPVGAPQIEGVQGRYFLPILAAAAIATGRLCPTPLAAAALSKRRRAILTSLLVAQLVVSDVTIASAYAVF